MKLVKEHINEVINFERKQDKFSSLGIGKLHLIKKWLDENYIKNYIINDDLTIDVKNKMVDIQIDNLIEFPDYIQFNKIGCSFACTQSNLISLKGFPKIVYGNFYCQNNNLTSLQGCPKYVNLSFYGDDNKKKFTVDEVRQYCVVGGQIYV